MQARGMELSLSLTGECVRGLSSAAIVQRRMCTQGKKKGHLHTHMDRRPEIISPNENFPKQ